MPRAVARTRRWTITALALGVLAVPCLSKSIADDSKDEPVRKKPAGDDSSERELNMKTLGGRQFWGDVLFFHDWRIQKSVLTGRYRLLDGRDFRHAAGTLDECRQKLEEIKIARKLPPMCGKGVILLHGIVRSSKSFSKMRTSLEQNGYVVFGFDYPSTRVEISDAAEYLRQVIDSLDGIQEINFVVHSMGGLVVRSYLKKKADPRIKRLVMIGVPNQGADLADRLKQNPLYRAIFGPAGQQLISDSTGYIASLPTPEFEFAIISGARGSLDGYNPLVPGDDDGTVAVLGTRLPGAADFITVRSLHAFLMSNDETIAYTLRFLSEGKLRDEGDPHPIPREDAANSIKPGSDNGVSLGKRKSESNEPVPTEPAAPAR